VNEKLSRQYLFLLIVSLLFLVNRGSAATITPSVTYFSPFQGPAGTVIDVYGSGLLGTTQVLFDPSNALSSAEFSIVDDTQLEVTVPPLDPNSPQNQSILVLAGNAATLAMSASAVPVNSSESYSGGTHYFIVDNGGTLTGGNGSALMYLKSGGTFNDAGGGTRIAVIESGSTYIGAPGGTTRVYAAGGANVTLSDGGSNSLTTLGAVTLSVVPNFYRYDSVVVPEPTGVAVAISAVFGLLACAFRYRRLLRP
jgi:hypothetical protein